VQFENGFDLSPEWSPARLDRRHQFNGYALFFLPHGFDASTGFKFQSGLPIDAAFGRTSTTAAAARIARSARLASRSGATRSGTSRSKRSTPPPVGAGPEWRETGEGHREVFNLFNWTTSSSRTPAPFRNYCAGTAPDDCGFGPPTNPNFLSLVDNVPGSPTFGQFLQTNNPGAPRQVQLGVRFEF